MKTEIKIRAWDAIYNKMVYPNFSFGGGGKTAGQLLDQEEILMLYTGIRDNKNNKEIYESDIVLEWGKPVLVEWANYDDGQGFSICTDDCDLEVIGNIYENPDLEYSQISYLQP